jgi:hypothetical protein
VIMCAEPMTALDIVFASAEDLLVYYPYKVKIFL